MLYQLGAADHLALVVHQVGEKLVLLRGKLHRLAVQRHLARAGVEADVARGQFRRGVARGAADEGAQPRDQLLGLEGLGKIIVGAGVQPGDLVRPAVARGEDEDGHGLALLAPAVEDGEAVYLGQAEVEDDGVVIFGGAEIMAVLAVGGEVDRVAGAFQRRAQLASEVGLVFDDQNAHPIPLSISRAMNLAPNRPRAPMVSLRSRSAARPARRLLACQKPLRATISPVRASTSIQTTCSPRMNLRR